MSTTTALTEIPDHKFKLGVGVRQGVESPLLYNLYMDFIHEVFMNNCKKSTIKFRQLRNKIP